MENEQVLLDHPWTEWVATVNAGDVERYLARLTVDVSWIPPGQVALNGRKAFEAWGRPFFSRFTYDFSLDGVSARVAGTWAVERGSFPQRHNLRVRRHSGTHRVRRPVMEARSR